MSTKTFEKIPIVDQHNDHESYIPVGTIDGAGDGPTVTVVGGIHGSEYAAHEGVYRFWREIDPAEVSGTINVVLAADVTAMLAHFHHNNPIDGKNSGRGFPGDPDGTLTEVFGHEISERFLTDVDAVIDCHGGEFNEDIDLYSITYETGDADLDEAMLGLARAAGFPFIERKDATDGDFGNGPIAVAGANGIPAVVVEAGGGGRMEDRHVEATRLAIWNVMYHMGVVEGTPVPYAGEPIVLGHAHFVTTTEAGIFEPAVTNDTWVQAGDHLATVRDFDGTVLEEVESPADGVVIMTWDARVIDEGGIAAFIGSLEASDAPSNAPY